jgi:hypothetical protein
MSRHFGGICPARRCSQIHQPEAQARIELESAEFPRLRFGLVSAGFQLEHLRPDSIAHEQAFASQAYSLAVVGQ